MFTVVNTSIQNQLFHTPHLGFILKVLCLFAWENKQKLFWQFTNHVMHKDEGTSSSLKGSGTLTESVKKWPMALKLLKEFSKI